MGRRLLNGCGFALMSAACNAPVNPQEVPTPVPAATPESPAALASLVVTPETPTTATATPATPMSAMPGTPETPVAAGAPVVPLEPPVIPDFGPLTEWVPRAPVDTRFKVAAYRDGELKLHLLGDKVFVSGAGGLAHLDASGDRLVHVEYGVLGQSEPYWWFDGWATDELAGVWPDNTWLTTNYGFSRSNSPPRVHRREGNTWKLQDTKAGMLSWSYTPILNWHSGQVLGLRTYAPDPVYYEDGGQASKAVERRIDAALAKVKSGFFVLGPTATPASMVLPAEFRVGVTAAAPTGELFMLAGKDPFTGRGGTRVQRWGLDGDAAITGTIDAMPKGLSCDAMVVHAATEAYLVCSKIRGAGLYILRFDGTSWSEEPAPPDAHSIKGLSIAPDGEMVAILGVAGEGPAPLARRRARGAPWERFEVPTVRFPDRGFPEWSFYTEHHEFELQPPDPVAAAWAWTASPYQVLARSGGEVWVAAGTMLERPGVAVFQQSRTVVMRAGEVREPLRMLPDGDLAVELLDWRAAPAWTPKGCHYDNEEESRPAFVPLRTLARDEPRNRPEPTIEAFVKDNAALMSQVVRAVEVFRRGRRTTGLYVQPTDQAGADALLAAIDRVVPGEKRTIECRLPRIRREFDKTTGQALQAPAL